MNPATHAGAGHNAPLDSAPINCERCGVRPPEIAPCPHCAAWLCIECLALPCASAPAEKRPTWTKWSFLCQACKRMARASEEAIEIEKVNNNCDGLTDREIGEGFEYCVECVSGVRQDGEHEVPE